MKRAACRPVRSACTMRQSARRCTTACLRDHVQSLVISVKVPRSPRQANAYAAFPFDLDKSATWPGPEGTWCVVSRASLSDPVLHIWNYSRSDVHLAVTPVTTSGRAEFSSTTFCLLAPVIGVCRRDLVTCPSLRETLNESKVLLAFTADESLPFRVCQSPNKRRNWP